MLFKTIDLLIAILRENTRKNSNSSAMRGLQEVLARTR